ncbi:MAG: twin-arginine translocation signal domain-containing protein [Kiritimatiellae bacterium]|nr:twin-arginine translocation signal domain-containing protein [Kiritimatiellia bacterium]
MQISKREFLKRLGLGGAGLVGGVAIRRVIPDSFLRRFAAPYGRALRFLSKYTRRHV